MRVDIVYHDGPLTGSLRDWTERRVLFAIGQFGPAVRAVRVSLADQNGPRGGPDQRCLMEARMARASRVVAEVVDADLYAAVSRAADRLHRRVRTALDRARTGRRPAPRDAGGVP